MSLVLLAENGDSFIYTLYGCKEDSLLFEGTIELGLLYSAIDDYRLMGYSDSDWGGDIDDRKSTSGFVFFMGNTAFTCISKKHQIFTLSICEAEHEAATSSVCHAVWVRNLLRKLETFARMRKSLGLVKQV
ncbi:hypothetical protein V2J09_022803 [Rumex salicifolius]